MTMYKSKIYVVLTLTILISSCVYAKNKDSLKLSSFNALYPNCDMNSTIIFSPPQANDKFDDYIILGYKNTSQHQVAFPPSSGVKIFVYEQNVSKWREVKNNMQYSSSPEPYIIIDPENEMTSYNDVVISPDISTSIPHEIRVAITGHIYLDGIVTDECVGAFIDIEP